jgi:hypothetical protein
MANLTIHSVDQRFSKRIKALRKGLISYNHGASTMDCSILDLSSGGARLRPDDPVRLPGNFRLRLTPSLTIGCEVVYREQSDIGVAFVPQ